MVPKDKVVKNCIHVYMYEYEKESTHMELQVCSTRVFTSMLVHKSREAVTTEVML